MQVIIAGAGSIGTVVGMLIASKGHSVEILRRRGMEGKQILELVGVRKMKVEVDVKLTHDNGERRPADLIFITTQIQQTTTILDYIADNYEITPTTGIVLLQNGLNAHRQVIRKFIDQPVVQGIVWWSATLVDERTVYCHRFDTTYIGHIMGVDITRKVYNLLMPELTIEVVDDVAAEVRKKVLLNIVSPILALTKEPYPQGLNNILLRKIVHHLFDEVISIATQYNWEVDDEKLVNFHAFIASDRQTSENVNGKYTHKVSTQLSAEKYGGKGSNTRDLLEFFISKDGKIAQLVVEEIELLPPNYLPLTDVKLRKLLNKFERHSTDCNLGI